MGLTQKLGTIPLAILTDASNNVGIGGSPSGSYKLEVTGTAKVSGILTLSSTISNGTYTYTLPSATGTLALTSALGDYLPLAGGTLTGALSGTSATFSSSVTSNVNDGSAGFNAQPTTTTNSAYCQFLNADGYGYIGKNSSAGGNLATGSSAYALVMSTYKSGGTTAPIQFAPNNSVAMTITSGGDIGIGMAGVDISRLTTRGKDSTTTNYAFIAQNSATTNLFLVRNDGAVSIYGALSKGSGSFKIDHPLESMTETHNLVHSFVESPQANNIYRGKVELVNGKAKVNLDEVSTMTEGTFVALNREIHTYTSNETDWDAVRGNVKGNILIIECQNNQSNAIVSWLVIGERQDKHMMETAWTDDNGRVIVEPLKEIDELKNK